MWSLVISISYRKIHSWCIIIVSRESERKKGRFTNFSRNPTCKTRGRRCKFLSYIAANYYSRVYVPCQSFGNSIASTYHSVYLHVAAYAVVHLHLIVLGRKIVAAPAGILIRRDSRMFRCPPISRAKLLGRANADGFHSLLLL